MNERMSDERLRECQIEIRSSIGRKWSVGRDLLAEAERARASEISLHRRIAELEAVMARLMTARWMDAEVARGCVGHDLLVEVAQAAGMEAVTKVMREATEAAVKARTAMHWAIAAAIVAFALALVVSLITWNGL